MIDVAFGVGVKRFVWFDGHDDRARLGLDLGVELRGDISSPSPVGMEMRVAGTASARLWIYYVGVSAFIDQAAWEYNVHPEYSNGRSWAWRRLAGVGITLSTPPASKHFLADLGVRWGPWLDGSSGTISLVGTISINYIGGYIDIEYFDSLKHLDDLTGGWLGTAGLLMRI